jgi:hypothetical protein
MSSPLSTSRYVKESIIEVCVKYLLRVGCDVTQTMLDADHVTLDIYVPQDPADVHGERLLELLNNKNAQTT